jgi:hypothetical protein
MLFFNAKTKEDVRMLNISDLDQLKLQLVEAKKALETLDEALDAVRVDPDDPASIDAAVQRVNAIIDARIGPYASNPIIAPLAQNMKTQYRESILAQAAGARSGS